jgi:hypothetical protein
VIDERTSPRIGCDCSIKNGKVDHAGSRLEHDALTRGGLDSWPWKSALRKTDREWIEVTIANIELFHYPGAENRFRRIGMTSVKAQNIIGILTF